MKETSTATRGDGAQIGARICFIQQRGIPPHPSRVVWQRARAISEAFDTWLITAGSCPEALTRVHVSPVSNAAMQSNARRRFLAKLRFVRGALAAVRRLAREGLRPDVVFTYQTDDLFVGALLQLCGFRWVVDILELPDIHLEDIAPALARRRLIKAALVLAYVHLARRLIRRADLIITNDGPEELGLSRILRDLYRVPPDRLLVVMNGIDPDLVIDAPGAPTDARPLRLVYVGAVSEHHGAGFLIRLLGELRARQKAGTVELSLVGPATPVYADELARECRRLNLDGAVQVLGQLSHHEAVAAISKADVGVYAFPQRCWHDPAVPIKVGEYMARGKPVLAADLSGARARVRDGVTGLLLPPGDCAAWAQAIEWLLDHPEERKRMGAAALKEARRQSWDGINRQVVARMRCLVSAR
jgi:glycosyltransferase involved in cell wall biosynthesis